MSGEDAVSRIRVERRGRAALLTIDVPDKLNALTHEGVGELVAALAQADADDAVSAVVLTGAGERAFCAGADVSRGSFAPQTGDPATGAGVVPDHGARVPLTVFEMNKPVIAAVNGAAVGMGASMAISADIRLASDNARFGFLYARRGIATESCASWFLPRLVGISRAVEWVSTGRMIPATEALEAGLVRSIHAPGDLLDAALALADEIALATAPLAVAVSRRLMWRMLGAGHPAEASALESRGLAALIPHRDAYEGVRAFSEKRPAAFTGRPSQELAFLESWWASPVDRA